MSKFLDSIRAYNEQMKIAQDIKTLKNNGLFGNVTLHHGPNGGVVMNEEGPMTTEWVKLPLDNRYNTPKEAPKASKELVEETIQATEIYRQARIAIMRTHSISADVRTAMFKAQAKQVAYGIDKYPEPLNANTWSISETIEHITDESIDKLHYLVMLRIKLEQELASGIHNDESDVRNANNRIANITRMITTTIKDLSYLMTMNLLMDRERESSPDEVMNNYCEEDVKATKLFADGIEFTPGDGKNE